jgi:hypothetical protein
VQISDYFAAVRSAVNQAEKEVGLQIKNSKNQAGLKAALTALHFKLNTEEMDRLQEEKVTIDDRINN